MNQREAVIKTMEENGGYATFGHLYQNVLQIKDCEWITKTPFASIRRIVQDQRYFFKIRPGLWALKTYKDKLPIGILPTASLSKSRQEEYSHTYYQGLLVEVGNIKKYQTFVPSQDKNKLYLGKKLCEMTNLLIIPNFTYTHILQKTKTIDVVWFNERNMPTSLFEIEHSTSMQNSLLKFVELQDFYTHFYIVADSVRKNDFNSKLLSYSAFMPIRKRTQFLSYENLFDTAIKL